MMGKSVQYEKTERTPLLDSDAHSSVRMEAEADVVPVFSRNERPLDVTVKNLSYWVRPSLDADWESLNQAAKCQLPKTRLLLDNVNIHVQAGQLLAVLGSSGSGKTTLLDVMAYRHEGGQITGDVLFNGEPRTAQKLKESGGYVQQEDRLLPNLTVLETLTFVARLKMPASLPLSAKEARVREVIGELGLIHVENSPIGGASLRGLSGGERRRVSIAMQLLLDPSILFLDEPTSGLDSFTANNVVATLQSLARSNRTIITTIHSPRSDVVKMFDLVLILSQGRTVYFGPSEGMVSYFANVGYPCPMYTNPCDFCLDLATIDFRSAEREQQSRKIVDQLVSHYSATPYTPPLLSSPSTDLLKQSPSVNSDRAGFFLQFYILLIRTWRNRLLGRTALFVDLVQALAMALVVGAVFLNLGHDQVSVQDRYGLFYIISTMYPFMLVLSTVSKLHQDRPSFYTEREDGLYNLLPFFFAKQIGELPFDIFFSLVYSLPIYFMSQLDMTLDKILIFNGIVFLILFTARSMALAVGAAIPRFQQAAFTANFMFTLFLLPCGFIVNLDTIWPGVAWTADISFVAFSFQSLSINEFVGVEFNCPNLGNQTLCPITEGTQALEAFALEDKSIEWSAIYMSIVAIVFRTFYYFAMRFIDQRPR